MGGCHDEINSVYALKETLQFWKKDQVYPFQRFLHMVTIVFDFTVYKIKNKDCFSIILL